MDVAGALGSTTIFPFLIGIICIIVWMVMTSAGTDYDGLDMVESRIATRFGVTGLILFILSFASWVVAIWLGFAQGAV